MVDFWSLTLDQIQIYPDQDTIAQLPARPNTTAHDCLREILNM